MSILIFIIRVTAGYILAAICWYLWNKLKVYLSRVFLTKGGKLKIFTELLPTFSPSDDTIKKVQKKQIKNNYPVAHKYYFRMYTKSDPEDGETIWEMAYSEAEAIDKAYMTFTVL